MPGFEAFGSVRIFHFSVMPAKATIANIQPKPAEAAVWLNDFRWVVFRVALLNDIRRRKIAQFTVISGRWCPMPFSRAGTNLSKNISKICTKAAITPMKRDEFQKVKSTPCGNRAASFSTSKRVGWQGRTVWVRTLPPHPNRMRWILLDTAKNVHIPKKKRYCHIFNEDGFDEEASTRSWSVAYSSACSGFSRSPQIKSRWWRTRWGEQNKLLVWYCAAVPHGLENGRPKSLPEPISSRTVATQAA